MMAWFVWLMWLWPVGPERAQEAVRQEMRAMSKDEIFAVAKERMRGLGVAEAALAKVAYGPPPLFDGTRTQPFHFLATKPEAGPPGRAARIVCVAVDARDGRVYHKDPAALGTFAMALGLPATAASLDANRIFTAMLALRDGEPPHVAKGPTGVGDPAIGMLVKPPVFEPGDIQATLVGWTSKLNGQGLVRHTLVFKKDGIFDIRSENGADLLK